MSAKVPTVGIDLGTTNSAVAFVDPGGHLTSVTNFHGDLLTPSAVFIEDNSAFVGKQAFEFGPRAPERFAEAFKRNMGEKFCPRLLDGRKWRPEVLSAMVLRKLRADVARTFDAEPGAAVITVPAYFDEGRRRATQNAGAIGNWEVADIINEPTAAAIAYAHAAGQLGRGGDLERVLVYDLGGGTFDTTLLEVRAGREYRAIATDGEVRLGGCDWDHKLCDHLAELFQKATGMNPLRTPDGKDEDLLGVAQFTRFAHDLKHRLTEAPRASVVATYRGKRAILEVTRATFENLTEPLLQRTRSTTEELLEVAKLTWNQVDRVLAVGGSTRMPMVSRMLEALTGKAPDRSLPADVSADEAVAHGAAVYASLKGATGAPRVVNVLSHDLRVVGRDGSGQRLAKTLIPRNSPLPAERAKLIPVLRAGLSEVSLPVREGESEDPELCEELGLVNVSGIPLDGRRWKVAVMLRCREDGTVAVRAEIRDPDKPEKVAGQVAAVLVPQRGMTPAEVSEARRLLDSMELN